MTGASDAVMCRGFFATLDGQAQDWFTTLPEKSISTFADLSGKFLSYYANNILKKKQFASMCKFEQGSTKTLTDYLTRWKKEARSVENFDEKAAIPIFTGNVRSGPFHRDLVQNRPKTYVALLDRAARFAEAEEAEKKKKEEERGRRDKRGYLGQYVKRSGQGRPQGPGNVWKKKGGSEPPASGSRKRELDQLTEEEERESGEPHPPKKQVIHVIFGGPEGGDTQSERKKWARNLYVGEVVRQPHEKKQRREPIIFTDDDLPDGPLPHRDALVITLDINNTIVHRVLVDTRSSVNDMYYEEFTKLGLTRKQLAPVRTPLSGFTGDSIETEGSINLEVEIGTAPHVKRWEVEFVVVKIECAHNIILDRPALEDLRSIISMEHLCLKFPTPTGVGVARGD
ncbi:uncharacterized protein LOC115995952 [Ipomoea triloba]|uniref:uncharacterized protein LOC115995952 n=1 Tax=Ipomoea triloba TaxID=35885 RepID=UPI00125E4E95|nr:uncharacterized protein LOC115995952 [Ipomoea triloba]